MKGKKKGNLKFLWEIFKPYTPFMLFAILGGIIESLALAGLAFIIKNIIDDVFIAKNTKALEFVVIAVIVIAFFKELGYFMRDYLYPLAIFKVLRKLRTDIYNRTLNAEPSFFMKNNIGDILSRITNDLEAFNKTVRLLSVNLVTQVFTVIAMIGVLVYRDIQLFLIFVISVPFLALALNYFGNKRKKYSQRLRESFADFTQHMNQILTGIEVVKLFNRKLFLDLFKRINQKLYHRQKKDSFYETTYLAIVEFIAYMATAAIQEEDRGIEFKGLKESIEYRNVNLVVKDIHILRGINLKIFKGEKLGIVGLTGSGKSTMIKILPAIVKNYTGEVLLDGVELKNYSVSSLRRKIGMISQDVFIFNDTVRNNLLIANPEASEEEIIEALRKAKAEFVFRLENGLDTVLGEKGSRLSGGERQRLSIARVFLKKPDILIIDEGTSALDVQTEEEVIKNIFDEFKNNTILMITHRLRILEKTERIIVVDRGRIVEEGTEEELMKKKGVFYRFIQISGEG